jgi:hypothetical protein
MADGGESWVSAFSALLGTGGLVAGVVLFVFGFVMAKHGVTLPIAIVLLGLAGMIGLAAGIAVLAGMVGSFNDVARLGPGVTPDDMAGGMRASLCQGALAFLGFVLAMTGAIRAMVAAGASETRSEQGSAEKSSLRQS